MKILIVTDAWEQINGVVRTLETTIKYLEKWGNEVLVIHPGLFNTIPLPFYPEIKLAIYTKHLFKKIKNFSPNVIHIATEGPLGFKVRNWCVNHSKPFTTAYHTKFPEYANKHFYLPLKWSYSYMRWFHSKSEKIMVNTNSMKNELESHGFKNLVIWSRGVDNDLFYPGNKSNNWGNPVWLNVGRVSVEKNLDEFLKLDLPGTKVIVGDGPLKKELELKYKAVKFLGKKTGEELAQCYRECDVMVFPSKSDTFGLVMLEANACGKPVAAYPVTGPIDVIKNGINGWLDDDLKSACINALRVNKENITKEISKYTWENCSRQFLYNLITQEGNYDGCNE